jgi:septum site-determining protein MinC
MAQQPAREGHHVGGAVDVRFGQVGVARVGLTCADPANILRDLTERVAEAPGFFRHTASVLDLSVLVRKVSPDDLRAVLAAVRRAGLRTVGITNVAPGELPLDLPIFPPVREFSHPDFMPHAALPPAPPSQMHHQRVRSGERLYVQGGDLIVTAPVGAGAEVIADGCVHVYSALRGRAAAGISGQRTARVFCHEFHAEMVSIAGVFRVFETLPPELEGKPVQAWLEGDELRFAPLGHTA